MAVDTAAQELSWRIAADLHQVDERVVEGTIMGGRCLRVGKEFLALVDFKRFGPVVKLPKERVSELIDAGVGRSFAPAGKVFREWLSVPDRNPELWRSLLEEGIDFVGA